MKYRLFYKEKLINLATMILLLFLTIGIGYKISKDFKGSVVQSQEELLTEAGETTIADANVRTNAGASVVSTTVTPSVTITTTPTPVPETSVIVDLDYRNETITVSQGPKGSTKFYYSQDKKKTWQLIERSNGKIDLTIFMKSSSNVIYFKGNKDENPVEVEIPKEDKSLKITYYVENNVGKLKIENLLVGQSLEYRKGKDGNWNVYNYALDLSDYEINGYTLQFRVMASKTQRAGKIVNVKIPKQQKPPSVKVDYDKFVITGVKAGVTQYRLAGSSNWITFSPNDSKIKTLSLLELLLPKDTPQNFKPIPAGAIEFRTLGTDKTVASSVLMVETFPQPSEPDASKITLVGTSLSFTDASREKPYEYLVAHEGEKIDLATAKWKKVTNTKPLEINKVGTATPIPSDIVYYRLASYTDRKTNVVTPASMYGKKVITAISKK